jgi:hypothetical protein
MPALDHSFSIGNEFALQYKNSSQEDNREGKEHLLATLRFFEALFTACWCVQQALKFNLFPHTILGTSTSRGLLVAACVATLWLDAHVYTATPVQANFMTCKLPWAEFSFLTLQSTV